MKARVGIFIQARSNSRRFPNKIYQNLGLRYLHGQQKALLEHIYDKLSSIDDQFLTVVLVPWDDRQIIDWCEGKNIPIYKGSHENVRERYRKAARFFSVDIVVRATADNPCVDMDIARETIEGLLQSNGVDLFSFGNLPLGIAVEAMTTKALLTDTLQNLDAYKEHVSVHIKKNPSLFTCFYPNHKVMLTRKSNVPLRLTVDTKEDLEVVNSIFSCLGPNFRLADILYLEHRHPELFAINRDIKQVQVDDLAL